MGMADPSYSGADTSAVWVPIQDAFRAFQDAASSAVGAWAQVWHDYQPYVAPGGEFDQERPKYDPNGARAMQPGHMWGSLARPVVLRECRRAARRYSQATARPRKGRRGRR